MLAQLDSRLLFRFQGARDAQFSSVGIRASWPEHPRETDSRSSRLPDRAEIFPAIRGGNAHVDCRRPPYCAAVRAKDSDGSCHLEISCATRDALSPGTAPIERPPDRDDESVLATHLANLRLVAMFHVKHAKDAISLPARPRVPRDDSGSRKRSAGNRPRRRYEVQSPDILQGTDS